MISAESNTYSYAADAARARWAAHVDGAGDAAVCVVSGEAAGEAVRAALTASFERLGYGRDACTFVALDAGEGAAISTADAYLLLESLDPLVLVATDSAAVAALAQIYRTALAPGKVMRLLGRDALAFGDFAGMLATPEGKRDAWAALKQLAR